MLTEDVFAHASIEQASSRHRAIEPPSRQSIEPALSHSIEPQHRAFSIEHRGRGSDGEELGFLAWRHMFEGGTAERCVHKTVSQHTTDKTSTMIDVCIYCGNVSFDWNILHSFKTSCTDDFEPQRVSSKHYDSAQRSSAPPRAPALRMLISNENMRSNPIDSYTYHTLPTLLSTTGYTHDTSDATTCTVVQIASLLRKQSKLP